MIFEEFLVKTIHQYFDFLLKEFDFKDFFTKETNRGFYCYYKKEYFLIRIHYSYLNHYLDVDFYKETDINKLIGADNISLPFIIRDKNPEYNSKDYDAIMPSVIPIEQSLETLSKLLKQYAISYLEGKEWKTWKDIK